MSGRNSIATFLARNIYILKLYSIVVFYYQLGKHVSPCSCAHIFSLSFWINDEREKKQLNKTGGSDHHRTGRRL